MKYVQKLYIYVPVLPVAPATATVLTNVGGMSVRLSSSGDDDAGP